MYEHKILCLFQSMKKMTKKMDNDIQMTKKLMTKKLCNHVYLKTMGKFSQTSPMENDGTVCYTVTLIKSFSFVPISFGYVIYKHHTVGIVLKVNPQSHCCYQTQSIKHTLRKISQYQDISIYSEKKKCACIYYSKAKIC